MYKAVVKWSGNHYHSDEIVRGSKIDNRDDGTSWLYDDEEYYISGIGDFTRHEWVEVIEESIEKELADKSGILSEE